ncbi:DoxX family protein [Flavobacterium sp. ACN6]|uniref:DoxX family protein n=1 Tax=Flavobacterium sp. ACN6 TaxID=1920426 RepID=UPI000BB37167|nr:MauE/DoxX family redox-associated membrane protein [Flavobacterium sp. ACN6]PBJ08048.1 hypothetical protein BSF42_37650 [Flavobacterium sp. ACN6]
MKWSTSIRKIIIEVICYFFASLFVYAAVSKILEFDNFQAQLGQSVIIGAYAGLVSYGILTAELAVAVLLVIPKYRSVALIFAFILMASFTVYIFIILNFSPSIPCSCGGILEKMGWKEHLVFNIMCVVVAAAGLLLHRSDLKKTSLELLVIFCTVAVVLSVMKWSSDYLIYKENPFIRRFVNRSCDKVNEAKLHNNTLYFAGSSGGNIYIGDRLAPLHLFSYDSALKNRKEIKIQLESSNIRFQSVQVKIAAPYFFVMDGTVPIIYRGKIADWKAEPVMKDNGYYFSKAAVIDSSSIAFRTQLRQSGENELGLFSFRQKGMERMLHTDLLQKQIDGFFDTDGMMGYSAQSGTFVYVYYYRNEFIVTDSDLSLRFRGKTIDTISKAAVKPVLIKKTGVRKLASAVTAGNRIFAVRGNQLFVNSSLMGRYEAEEMWDIASIVDVYNLKEKSYVSSFYIYDQDGSKMSDMLVEGNNVYVIAGMTLYRYKLDRNLKLKLKP